MRFTARTDIFYFTSAKLLHFDIALFLKSHYCCELACQGIWVCVCFVKHYTVTVCIYTWQQSRSAAPSWTKSCISWFSEEVLRSVWMLLYFYVPYVDNMLEWDTVPKHLNWYSSTTGHGPVLWTPASDDCFHKNSDKRVLVRWKSLLHFGPLHEDENNCSWGTSILFFNYKESLGWLTQEWLSQSPKYWVPALPYVFQYVQRQPKHRVWQRLSVVFACRWLTLCFFKIYLYILFCLS